MVTVLSKILHAFAVIETPEVPGGQSRLTTYLLLECEHWIVYRPTAGRRVAVGDDMACPVCNLPKLVEAG